MKIHNIITKLLLGIVLLISTTSQLRAAGTDDFVLIMKPVYNANFVPGSYTVVSYGDKFKRVEGFIAGKWTKIAGTGSGAIGSTGTFTPTSGASIGLNFDDTYEVRLTPDPNPSVTQKFEYADIKFMFASTGGAFTVIDPSLKEVTQWGTARWEDLTSAFDSSQYLEVTATDLPDFAPNANLSAMFSNCYVMNSSNLTLWDTHNVKNMLAMFSYARAFNQPIGNWDTANVVDMASMFAGTMAFDQDISFKGGNIWNTGKVMNMGAMFANTSKFNQPIGNWDTHNVQYMVNMFYNAQVFNQPIGSWDTQNVVSMSGMFAAAQVFNQPIGSWDTHNVQDMSYMFSGAPKFNLPIGSWDTHNVKKMSGMFQNATAFNQYLGSWNISQVGVSGSWNSMEEIFSNSSMSTRNIDEILICWSQQPVQAGVVFSAKGRNYCNANAQIAINTLRTTYGWNIDTTSAGALAQASCPPLATCLPTEQGTIKLNGAKIQGCTGRGWIDLAGDAHITPVLTNDGTISFDPSINDMVIQQNGIQYKLARHGCIGFLTTVNGQAPQAGTVIYNSTNDEFYYAVDNTQWIELFGDY